MKYCSQCAAKVSKKTAHQDAVPRYICEGCGAIHYQNPTVIAGCVAHWQGKMLLCQRAIEPGTGSWTLPAGFMENGESIEQAAIRETYEETGARVTIDALYSVFYVEQTNQVYIIYRAHLNEPDYHAGPESLAVKLFAPDHIPWDQLFYPAIGDILKRFTYDLQTGISSVYTGSTEQGNVLVIDRILNT